MALPKNLDIDRLLVWRRYLSIVHHVPGRIRLQLRNGTHAAVRGLDVSSIEAAMQQVPGIHRLRLNPSAACAVLEYDARLIAPSVWQELLEGSAARVEALLTDLLPSESN